MLTYWVEIRPHYSGLVVGRFPDIPDITMMGRDAEEVLARAPMCLEQALSEYLADRRCFPQATSRVGHPVTTTLFQDAAPTLAGAAMGGRNVR